ncbi:KpsF/GutQ family sugar-phosphate isomerase [candidate division KSB1 bacterium]|nr:KpsF/GutQ family sugar-phosphate isomerase [candidate division KSB1 bacterium]
MLQPSKENNGNSQVEDPVVSARRVLQIESDAVAALIPRVGDAFVRAVHLIHNCSGRIIITGIGKSGIVAKKIAATLTSTGTTAFYLHPVEALHGDIGMVMKNDVVICISKSGDTDEITRLFPVFKAKGIAVITLTGNLRSALALRSDVVLDVGVTEEACPYDLAPTASTTATLAMGDALAVALLKKRNFKSEDFALLHPGGALGKKLLKVKEVMFTGDQIPRVEPDTPLGDAIIEITEKRFGCACVVNKSDRLLGIITDGDLRRGMQQRRDLLALRARDIMNKHPKTMPASGTAMQAMQIMSQHNITQVIVVNNKNQPVGIVHLHNILEAGITRETL